MSSTYEAQSQSSTDGHIGYDALQELFNRTFERRRKACDCSWTASTCSMDHVNEDIAYDEFFAKYIFRNQPCIIGKWITRDWKATSDWVTSDTTSGKSQINFSILESLFGNAKVPVADCSNRYYNSQCKVEMIFSDYISYLKMCSQCSKKKHTADRILYLKDWHFRRDFPDYQAYNTPKYFTSDWLNYTCDRNSSDDYRFVYIGPKNSWTPFHVDVYRSFSWSANVTGRKRWLLFSPGEETKMKDKLGNFPYDVRNLITTRTDINFLDVIQEEGEVIFVPSGWYHQVQNIEDTISINHNWLNGASISRVTRFLSTQAALVRTEIDDCKSGMTPNEWNNQCEVILRADSGMNIHDFVKFLDIIACSRSAFLNCTGQVFYSLSVNEHHHKCMVYSDLVDIIKATVELCPAPKSGYAACSCAATDKNISLQDEFNHENSDLCFHHAMFDLYMLLDAIESIREVCIEISDTDLLVQLNGIHATVLGFFRVFVQKFEESMLSHGMVTTG